MRVYESLWKTIEVYESLLEFMGVYGREGQLDAWSHDAMTGDSFRNSRHVL